MKKLIFIIILAFGYFIPVGAWRPTPQPSNSITISALPAYHWLNYHKNDVRSTGNFDIGFGLTYRHQFNENWQLAIGANYRKYYGNMDYNGMVDSAHFVTIDEGASIPEQKYFLYQIFNSTEVQTVTYIEPNIRLEYVKPLNSAIDFIGGIGLAYGINIAETNEMTEGSYQRYAYFYENHNLIENFLPMNLGTYSDFLNPLQGTVFKHSLFALGEIGVRFDLSSNWQLLAMLSMQYSIPNIQNLQDVFTHHESYSGIAKSEIPKGVHAISVGVEVGFTYRFSKSQRMRAIPCPAYN
jgi:hypothetical protein